MDVTGKTLGRRELLVRTAPACAMACLGAGSLTELAASVSPALGQEGHKFDLPLPAPNPPLTRRIVVSLQNQNFFRFIRTLNEILEKGEVLRLLNADSEKRGRGNGESQSQNFPDTSFKTFVAQFRPPEFANQLTHEVVVDTEDTFELRVTECIWAAVFQDAGLDGDIGHAAVCNMDYYWPTAFNPNIRMERSKTLMQGHDCCNHRYMVSADPIIPVQEQGE